MNELLHVSTSPHIRQNVSTQSIMRDVCIALLAPTAFGVYNFGFYALLIVVICVASCVVSEWAFEKITHRPVTISDLSAVVTGMILALNLPPAVPLWIPVIGGVFAIIVVKQLFGGIGQNFMNPALAARVFLLISFAAIMTDYSVPGTAYDTVSSATALTALKAHQPIDLWRVVLGTIPGSIGETSTIALAIGAAYMLIRRVIGWRIPVIYIGTFAIIALFYSHFDFYWTLCEICAGGLFFGAFYMANDYVTHPLTPLGHYIYAVFLGVLTAVFRFCGNSVEGVSYAIILGNVVTPVIERFTLPRAFGKERDRK